MIVMVGAEKGGVGKSTITANLAIYMRSVGYTVGIFDADPQGTITNFIRRRNALPDHKTNEIHLVTSPVRNIPPAQLVEMVNEMEAVDDMVFIDAGGRDSQELRTGLLLADVFIVPTRPSQADLETLGTVEDLIVAANNEREKQSNPPLKSFAVLSIAPTNPVISEIREARAALEQLDDIKLLSVTIHERKIYRDALLVGKGVSELDKSSPAKAEIHLLAQEIFSSSED